MKTTKKIALLILLAGLFLKSRAQIFNSGACSTAVSITATNTPQTVQQSNTDGWMSFTANAPNMYFGIKNVFNGATSGKILSATVYGGSCGTLTQLATDSVVPGNDTLLILGVNGLSVGSTYYIYTYNGNFPGQCLNQNNCSSDAIFTIVSPQTGQCNFYGTYIMDDFCGVGGLTYALVNCESVNDPCAYPNPLCYSPFTNTLILNYAVPVQGGLAYANNWDMIVLTDGTPSSYTLSVTGTTAYTFPFLATSNNPTCAGVSYTIQLYPPGQIGMTGPCREMKIEIVPKANPDFTVSSLCAGAVCMQPATLTGNHLWTVIGTPYQNINQTSPCFNLAPGTYTIQHHINATSCGVICSVCLRKVITISPPYQVTASASADNICLGNGVTLSAFSNVATSYTWQPGNLLGSNVTVFPTSTTTYTVFTDNGQGCIEQAMVTVNVYTASPSFVVTLQDQFFCIPKNSTTGSVTLTANPPAQLFSYTVTIPGFPVIQTQFTNSIVLTPSGNTTYTVATLDQNGCYTSTVVTVTQVPCQCLAVTAPTVGGVYSGNQAFNFVNYQSKLKVVSDVTLNLSCSQNLQLGNTEYIVYPGVKITITSTAEAIVPILGSYFHGCGEMWEGIVSPVTEVHIALDSYTTGINSAIPTLIEDAKVGISLNNSVSNGICISPNPQNAYYLRVANTIFNKCITGVQVINSTNTVYPVPYEFKNNLFTSRNLGVTAGIGNNISTWPTINQVKNMSSGLSSMETPYINNTMFPPVQIASVFYGYFGFPQCGILLNNVGFTDLSQNPPGYRSITIGGNGNTQFNCFDHLMTDINLINSNVRIFNCVFQNAIRDPKTNNLTGGMGISATSTSSNKNQLIVSVNNGNGNASFPCSFYDKTSAIDVADYHTILIDHAQFYSVLNNYLQFTQGNTFGSKGINIQTNRYLQINASTNSFYNIKNAVMIVINNQLQHRGLTREVGQIIADNNNVNRWNNSPIPGSANPYVNIGVYVADPVNVPGVFPTFNNAVSVDVSNNTFNKVYNGIASLNFAYSPVSIHNNTMTMLNQPIPFCTLSCLQRGVFAANQAKSTGITLNSITGPVNIWGDSLKGISTVNNMSLAIRCNTTANTARGIEFNGREAIDFYEDNSMIGSTLANPSTRAYGHVLDNQATLNTPSFVVGSTGRPTNNIWQEPWQTAVGGDKTATFGSSAQNAKLYIQYILPFDPDGSWASDGLQNVPFPQYFHSAFAPPITLLQSTVPFLPYGCRIGQGGSGGAAGQIALLEQIATGGLNNQNNPIQSAAIDKHFAYRAVKANPIVMVNSATLTSFYANAQTSNLQGMASIEENLANNNLNNAQNQINAFIPANSVETNYKTYYTILKNWKDSTYTQNDSLSLITLANGCPYLDGMVVYQAQTLYNAIYKDYFKFRENCGGNNQQARLINQNAIEKKAENELQKSTLFPNPNNGNFVLRISDKAGKQSAEITIFDITGREVYHENRQIEGEQQMNVGNDLLNGTYLVKVKLADGTTDVHRLVISK